MTSRLGRGLAVNPFSAARFAPGVIPWFGASSNEIADLFDRAALKGSVQQVLGAHGTGKSTLLTYLEREGLRLGASVVRFRGSHGVRLSQLLKRPKPGQLRIVLLDEAQELSAFTLSLLRLVTRLTGAALVMSVHEDFGVPTLVHRRVEPHVAQQVIALLAGGNAPIPSLESVRERLARHHGNLREVLFELYDEAERDHAIRASGGAEARL